MIVVWFCINVA